MTPDTAMFFAAGHGTRMRELTRDRPKPMIPLGGVPLIDRALDWADGAGIQNRVVNVHYLGEMLADHLKNRPGLQISEEPAQALETGGGLKQALPLLGRDPVYTLNPDALWTGANPFTQLAAYWRPEDMDALLLLVPNCEFSNNLLILQRHRGQAHHTSRLLPKPEASEFPAR